MVASTSGTPEASTQRPRPPQRAPPAHATRTLAHSYSSGTRERRIRVALVGTGKCARESFTHTILQNQKFQLRALWSRTEASAERFNVEVAGRSLEAFHGEEGFSQLLERTDIEGFLVALPASVQSSYVFRILQAGRHVLSENPVAPDSQTAQDMMKKEPISDKCVWFISDPLRYEPVFRPANLRLHELSPILAGEVYGVLVVEPTRSAMDRSDECLFVESAIHYISVLRQLLGEVVEVSCLRTSTCALLRADDHQSEKNEETKCRFWKDAVSGTIRFDSGTVCAVNWQTSGSIEDARFRLTLWGVKGSVTVEQEVGAQASASGVRRYVLRRHGGQSHAGAGCFEPLSVASSGAELQLEAWGRAIRAAARGGSRSESEPENGGEDPAAARDMRGMSRVNSMVDVIIIGAMLQSHGTRVVIRESGSTSDETE